LISLNSLIHEVPKRFPFVFNEFVYNASITESQRAEKLKGICLWVQTQKEFVFEFKRRNPFADWSSNCINPKTQKPSLYFARYVSVSISLCWM
jgi:hypothetical protein